MTRFAEEILGVYINDEMVDKMIVTIGSIALDTTRTPKKTVKETLGGSGTFFSISASFFHKTGLVGVIGSDFPRKYRKILDERVDLRGLKVKKGETFRYDSSFDFNLKKRTTIKTELNVVEGFEPIVPEEYRNAEYVYLGNIDPDQQLKVLDQMYEPKLVVSDTIELWIKTKREKVIEVISRMDGVFINDDEIMLLCGSSDLIKCSNLIFDWGAKILIVKRGEHGAIFSNRETIFSSPAYPLDEVVDPTGAGDSFAGGVIGYIARRGVINEKMFKMGVVYGNVMGSFVVEGFGVNRLLSLTIEDIEERVQKYTKLVESFNPF